MKFVVACLSIFLLTSPLYAAGPSTKSFANKPTIFIVAADGFDIDLTAALEKKKTLVTVVEDKTKAEYVLEVAPVISHEESTGSKVARCLFMDCIGMNGFSAVSVKLTRIDGSAVVWAYQVRKAMSGPVARQSLSEAIAKHLKNDYLNKQR